MAYRREEIDTDPRVASQEEMEQEGRAITGGPGIVGTKSQMQGAGLGILLGTIVGGLIGLGAGLVFFEGATVIVTLVVGVVAGATFGFTAGGFVGPVKKLDGTDADT